MHPVPLEWLSFMHCVPGDVYEKIANASENPSIAIFSDVVSASTSLLQGEMDNFEASCQILMNTLDAVAKIHPFVTS